MLLKVTSQAASGLVSGEFRCVALFDKAFVRRVLAVDGFLHYICYIWLHTAGVRCTLVRPLGVVSWRRYRIGDESQVGGTRRPSRNALR